MGMPGEVDDQGEGRTVTSAKAEGLGGIGNSPPDGRGTVRFQGGHCLASKSLYQALSIW
jgi:hypothetical protein